MKITESESLHHDIDKMSVMEILNGINQEDQKVAFVIQEILPSIEKAIDLIFDKMILGGRLFYIGSGTSGRLGIVDASECPPTFGVPHDVVIGIISGGDTAIRKAVEGAEDDIIQAWSDIMAWDTTPKDTVIGISASGSTPYVLGGLKQANENQLLTIAIVNNPNSVISQTAFHTIEAVVGPEFITGSTRMKSGTAQKMILNMISTTLMVKLGHVVGNKMVDMQLTNAKLRERAIKMVMEAKQVEREQAETLLNQFHSVRKAIESC